MIKTIIFDVGSVITKANWENLYTSFAIRIGVEPAAVIEYHNKNLTDLLLGHITFANFIQDLTESVSVTAARDIWIEEALKQTQVNTHLLDAISTLRGKYILQILTNISESRLLTDQALGFYDQFDYVLLSCVEHLVKPDPRFYRLALSHAQAEPREAIFIDDTQKQVKAAQQLGIHGIVFLHNQQLQSDLEKLL